jgi:glutathione S-transferase
VGLPDTGRDEPSSSCAEAAHRLLRHKDSVIASNPCAVPAVVDEALRCALTLLLTGEPCTPPRDSDAALRYVRDRINVPRDMSLWAARRLREALEATASLAGPKQGPAIPFDHRRDQNPVPFRRTHQTTARS